MFDGLKTLSNTTKHDQTATNKVSDGKMFDGVWSPNNSRLFRPLDIPKNSLHFPRVEVFSIVSDWLIRSRATA